MKRSRQVATLLMILSLALGLVACGGPSDSDAPQTGEAPAEEAAEEQAAPEEATDEAPEEQAGDGQEAEAIPVEKLRVAYVEGTVPDDVAAVEGQWGCEPYGSVDALAQAIIAGNIDVAVVSPDVASALYNATAGSLMAVDAVALPDEGVRAASVVRLPVFLSSPETVVAYVARHQELVAQQLGQDAFLTGSPMQRELSEAIGDAYVENPSSVGGELPPDNFYFLG